MNVQGYAPCTEKTSSKVSAQKYLAEKQRALIAMTGPVIIIRMGVNKLNVLEHYIKEVYSVETLSGYDWSCVEVDMLVNCYGIIERVQHPFTNMEEWEKAKEKGYYLS